MSSSTGVSCIIFVVGTFVGAGVTALFNSAPQSGSASVPAILPRDEGIIKRTQESGGIELLSAAQLLDRRFGNEGVRGLLSKIVQTEKEASLSLAEEIITLFSSGRISSNEFTMICASLGEKADLILAKRILEDEALTKGNPAAVKAFTKEWAKNSPKVALDYFRSVGGDTLAGCDKAKLNALFEGLMAANSREYLGLRSEIDPNLEPNFVAAWATQQMREVGFDQAFIEIRKQIEAGDTLLKSRGLANLQYEVVQQGLVSALNAGNTVAQFPDSVTTFSMAFGAAYPAEALSWAASIDTSEDARSAAINGVMSIVGQQHPDMALDFVESFTGSRDEQINMLLGLRSAFRSTKQEDWVKQIDDILYQDKVPGWEERPSDPQEE